MAHPPQEPPHHLRLQELCERLGVPYRDARYFCERGWLPEGIDPGPGRGNHRLLTPAQAVWLGVVLKLKACGVRTRLAAQVAAFAGCPGSRARGPGGGGQPPPCAGAPEAGRRWLVEVGDMRFIRFVADAGPGAGSVSPTPWLDMASSRAAEGAAPVVSIRVDLSALARLLGALEG